MNTLRVVDTTGEISKFSRRYLKSRDPLDPMQVIPCTYQVLKCGMYFGQRLIDGVIGDNCVRHLLPLIKDIILTEYTERAIAGTEALAAARLPQAAPPVFLLDADRRYGAPPPAEGQFDNRSVSFATDFPSASFLQSQGIRRVLLVQREQGGPQSDLAHTLRRWHAAGIPIDLQRIDRDDQLTPCAMGRPSIWGETLFRLSVLFKLRRNPLGGYGGLVAASGSGG